jgi:cysteine-S-conjugate beta-lyase
MKYNFDKAIDRRNTNSLKHDFNQYRFGREDILPMWVADMDFETPGFIVSAMQQRLDHPVYGYTIPPKSLYQAIIDWIRQLHGWEVDHKWLTFCTGVVPTLDFCVKAFTKPGDKVIVQPPVYYPFFSAITNNGCIVQNNPLKMVNGQYEMDFEDLEKNTDEKTKLIFLCTPHNPGGRVWPLETLQRIAQFCIEKDIMIISDEVHADMVYKPARHIPLASLSKEISAKTITLMAPTKTFNLAGLAVSYVIVENRDLLDRLNLYLDKSGVNSINVFAQAAVEAAHRHGHEWLEQLMQYLQGNFNHLKQYLSNRLPMVEVMQPEATYLAWMDFKKVPIEPGKLNRHLVQDAGLGLNDGAMFGMGGEHFQRINFACPRQILDQGLIKLSKSIEKLV